MNQKLVYAFILIALIAWACIWIEREYFIHIENVDFYVITMGNEDRLENIRTQLKKMNTNAETYNVVIYKVDAVVGKTLDLDALIHDGTLSPNVYVNEGAAFNVNLENRKNEVGCNLSHLKTYRMILDAKAPNRFSVIFEDDFEVSDQFLDKLDGILEKVLRQNIEFDILMLSMLGNVGEKVYEDIYKINCPAIDSCYYSHAYIVNNKNIDRVVDAMKYIERTADIQMFKGHNDGKIKILRTENSLVNQNSSYTTIRNN